MRTMLTLTIFLVIGGSFFLPGLALARSSTKLQLNADTLSTNIPRYRRQGHRSYLALVRCEYGEIRLKGTRSEGTKLSLTVVSTNLVKDLSTPLKIGTAFYSSGPAIMKKGQYYLMILTENPEQTLEAHPFGFADFVIQNRAYRLTDYLLVAEKEAPAAYDKYLPMLNNALDMAE